MSSTATYVRPNRKKLADALRPYHQRLFDALGIPNAQYYCKSFSHNNFNGSFTFPNQSIGFFESELKANVDIYFELTDFETNPLPNENRQLYVLKANSNYRTLPNIYHFEVESPANKLPQYYVKPERFQKVFMPVAAPVKELEFLIETEKEGDNLLFSNLTARDRTCISLKVPDSSKHWINELIEKSL